MAKERVSDAAALLDAGRWSGAYYLAGYAVECGLKACVAKLTKEYDFPDKDRAVKAYTHNIEALVLVAELKVERDADARLDLLLKENWVIVAQWNEAARYSRWAADQARRLYDAVTLETSGVLPWIEQRW
jgi:HEPN domain-containing protein